jgi:ribosomal protein L17
MLTNLVKNGKVTTTSKRAAVLKSEADSLISRLISNTKKYSEADARRENIRLIKSIIYSEAEGKKLPRPQGTQDSTYGQFVIRTQYADYQ